MSSVNTICMVPGFAACWPYALCDKITMGLEFSKSKTPNSAVSASAPERHLPPSPATLPHSYCLFQEIKLGGTGHLSKGGVCKCPVLRGNCSACMATDEEPVCKLSVRSFVRNWPYPLSLVAAKTPFMPTSQRSSFSKKCNTDPCAYKPALSFGA